MSFASDTKKIICKQSQKSSPCCETAELAGILCFAGAIESKKGITCLKAVSENASVAQRLCVLLACIGMGDLPIEAPTSEGGWYVVRIEGDRLDNLADALGMIQDGEIVLYPDSTLIRFECCKHAFIKGAFLGGGSITSPDKEYHAEFVTKIPKLADMLTELLSQFDIKAHLTVRKENFVVYIKESESIASLLGLVGAGSAMMELYNIKIEKELRATVNRQVNCDTANLGKITTAAQKQLAAIYKIKNSIGLDKLPDNLRQMALLRLENPDASLKELGAMAEPPVGKSGVNHRLDRIIEIAEER